jgi:AraC-like DNA-binding protein
MILDRGLISRTTPINTFQWNAIARGNIGDMSCRLGEYEKGIPLLKMSIDSMLAVDDYRYACGRAIDLASAFIHTNNRTQAWRYLTLARKYNNLSPTKRNAELYFALSNYYLFINDATQARMLMDSAIIADRQENEMIRELKIALTSADTEETALSAAGEQMHGVAWLLVFIWGGILCLGCALFVFFYYRHVKQKETMQKAASRKVERKVSEIDIILYNRITFHLQATKAYTDPNFSLAMLSGQLNVGRTQLSNAINLCGQLNFNELINHYRIVDAIELLKQNGGKYTTESVAMEVGFRDRSTFYRAFKRETGRLPSEFHN